MIRLRHIFLLVSLFTLSLAGFAGSIEKTYTFGAPAIRSVGEYQLLSFASAMPTGPQGEPALPWQSINLLLPPGESAVSIKLECSDEAVLTGRFTIYPQQLVQPVSGSSSGTFLKNESVYLKNSAYPSSPTGKLITSFMHGAGFALSSFTPVRYNPATGAVSYFKSVKVIITTSGSENARHASAFSKGRLAAMNSIRKLADNPQMAEMYQTDAASSDGGYELLIITNQAYLSSFDALRAKYLEEGLRSEVVSRESINTSMTGADIQEKIRNYIIQEYQQHGIQHVILGGDDEIIPHRGFYCEVQSSSLYTDNNIPSDLYYSALDGNWNTDGDSKWAEPGEDDLLPEVAVSRMPFSTAIDLQRMLNKSTLYQFTPVTGELRNMILAGENLYNAPATWGSDYLELLIGERSDNGYTTTGIPADYPFDKMYDQLNYWEGSTLINHLNQGRQMLHHSGHANDSYVMKLSNSDITDANFYNVNGIVHNFTMVYTHGCYCGAFDVNDCIAEKMVSIQNFAYAFIGNSRYGWFNEGQTEGPSAHLHREFVDALFHDKLNRLGRAHMESRAATASWVTAPGQWEPGALRWCFYCCNVLGDGALAAWTDEPVSIDVTYPSTVYVGSSSMNVNVMSSGNPLENMNCVVMTGGAYIGKGVTDASGNAVIVFDSLIQTPVDAQLIVSGYNCLPATYTFSFVPAAAPYVIFAENILNDATGNQNGLPDFGEQVTLTTGLRNMGEGDALNTTATLGSADPYITLSDDNELYPLIAPGDTVFNTDAFAFTIGSDIPDQHMVAFTVAAVTGSTTSYSGFNLIVNAPALSGYDLEIDDASGNGNGRLDPGETVNITVPCTNQGHAMADNCLASLQSLSPYLQITSTSVSLGALGAGQIADATFQAQVVENAPAGTVIELAFTLQSAGYVFQQSYYPVISFIAEDFESGNFSMFNWNMITPRPWSITGSGQYEGDFCSRSGVVADNESSTLSIRMNILQDDSISFWSTVSCEELFDNLEFRINYETKGRWSGETGWERHAYPVTKGVQTFNWVYMKDYASSAGADRALVDFIVFPAFDYLTATSELTESDIAFTISPNPASERLHVQFLQTSDLPVSYMLLSPEGKTVMKDNLDGSEVSGSEFVLNISALAPGNYSLVMNYDKALQIRKFVIR